MNMEASSSSSIPKKRYNVFLSFRGEDTRYNFTSHLYDGLCRKKIKTYIDNNLNRGEEISSGLLKAIEESEIAVIIFSKDYASFPWCLDELLHILWCMKNYKQAVIPVFYHVDPSVIRKQLGPYEKAFQNLQNRFKDESNKVQKWRIALVEAANLSGWSIQNNRSESEYVKEIVGDIIKKLNLSSSSNNAFKDLVGIDQPINEIESLLQLGFLDVRVIGIWGMGGLGKTTLARVMFNKLYSHFFEGHCFLANVRDDWGNSQQKHKLRDKLFSELLQERDMCAKIPSVISDFDGDRLSRTKVLVVVDDVNDPEQLKYLIGNPNTTFGPGSRIIITSRDRQLFEHQVDGIYQVKRLGPDDSRQLFQLNAFRRNFPMPYCPELLEKVVEYAEGVPLALEVLGSHTNFTSKENLETLWDKLKNSVATDKIQNVLMTSYNGLSKKQRNIFLDIACFFRGYHRSVVGSTLENCGFSADSGIDDLVDKSLITISDGMLCMHDLVQEMGQNIVYQQSIEQPGERSRLWMTRDIYHVFKNNTATRKIEGISLNVYEMREVHLSPQAFRETYNLRLLKIYGCSGKCKVYLPNGLQCLPDELRYLQWEAYPAKSLPSNFAPEKLVKLIMTSSRVERLWDGVQNLWSLKVIDLSYSKNLAEVPDLSQAPKLETIYLVECPSLLHVPSHKFQNLDRLLYLDMSGCEQLRDLPDSIQSVEYLSLTGCKALKYIPEIKRQNVFSLELTESGIEELPVSIGSFHNLKIFEVENCIRLKNLPSSLFQLQLLYLDLSGCSSLQNIPELPRTLLRLCLYGIAIEEVPSSIELLSNLKIFNLKSCKKLRSLPTSICKLKSLEKLYLSGCLKFEEFPEILEPMEHLTDLWLVKTAIRTLPSSIENLVALTFLNLELCTLLEFVPSSIYKLDRLKELYFSDTSELFKWPPPGVESFSNLYKLSLVDCNMLAINDNLLSGFESIRELHISIQNLDVIPEGIARFPNLQYLDICNWTKLRSLIELPCDLYILHAEGCTSLESVPSSRNAIVQGFLDRKWFTYYRSQVMFVESLRLDQNARDNIIADGQLRILLTAIDAFSAWFNSQKGRGSCICYQGNEIPDWFPHQAIGSSITIKLPSNWWNTEFLGFSICLLAAFQEHDYYIHGILFEVEFEWKTNSGEHRKYVYHLEVALYNIFDRFKPMIISSDHVFMWYECDSFNEVCRASKGIIKEVSFHFRPVCGPDKRRPVESYKVKSCGIRLLFLQDLEELGVSIPPDYWKPEVGGHRKRRAIDGNANAFEKAKVLLYQP